MLCSCGEHPLGDGPYEKCHVCWKLTTDRPCIVWIDGECRVLMPICHLCSGHYAGPMSVPVHRAPADVVRRAFVLGAGP
jgi:hypothetical protein